MTSVNAALAFKEMLSQPVDGESLFCQIEKSLHCKKIADYVCGVHEAIVSVPKIYADGREDASLRYDMKLICSATEENGRGIVEIRFSEFTQVDDVGIWQSVRPMVCDTIVSVHRTELGDFGIRVADVASHKSSYRDNIEREDVVQQLGQELSSAIIRICDMNPDVVRGQGFKALELGSF